MSVLRRLAPFADSRPRLFLTLVCLVMWLPGFFALPPTDRDESRFAQATKQMLETGDFVRIMNGTVPRNRKPIGIYWLQTPFAAAARATGLATGNPIWPYRLPSLLGGIAAVLATHALALILFANRRAALLAGGMLAGCVLLTVEAHIAKTDAALLGATTLAMAVLARAWSGQPMTRAAAALFWLALGVGVLLKGPITPMVVGLTALTLVLTAQRVAWLAPLRPATGIPLLLLVTAPWFIAIGLATHGEFFRDAVGTDLGRKLAGGEESHGGPPGLHLLLLPLLVFPATLPVLAGLADAWRRRAEPATQFLLAWLIPSWLVFEAVPTKLPHYTLPLYPALILLGTAWLCRPRAAAAAPWLAYIPLGLAACVLGAGAVALPLTVHGPVWLGVAPVLGAGAALVLAWRQRIAASLVAAAALYALTLQVEIPSLTNLWIAPRAVAALRANWPGFNPQGEGLITAGYAEPSLVFLGGTKTILLARGDGGAQVLAATPNGAALVERHVLPAFEAEAARLHLVVSPAAVISGYNYAHDRAVQLTLFVHGTKK
jgi:4-amino-4-deoxy-L-arabinose transferase-like glycosyltransferase